MKNFNGLIPAVFTPMNENCDVDIRKIPNYVEHLINNKASGIYLCGSTGEGISLTTSERMQTALAFIDSCSKRINVIIQTGHNSLRDAKALAAHAQKAGADAVAAVLPSYFKPSSADNLIDCLQQIAGASPDIPFFYYHVSQEI